MALYRHVRDDYEKAIRMGHLHGIRPKLKTTQSENPVSVGDERLELLPSSIDDNNAVADES